LGTRTPEIANGTEGLTFPARFYVNRHLSQFTFAPGNFGPSKKPFEFKEAVKPLSGEAMTRLSVVNTNSYMVNYDIVRGIGPYSQYNLFSRKTKTAIAKFLTYQHRQDFETMVKNLA